MPLKMNFVQFETNEDENYLQIAMCDDLENTNEYLILQRAISFDEQDIELGMNSHYFELNDQANSGYGICENVQLSNKELTIKYRQGVEFFDLQINLNDAEFDTKEFQHYLKNILQENFVG